MRHSSSVEPLKLILTSSALFMSGVFACQGADVGFYAVFKGQKYNQGGAGRRRSAVTTHIALARSWLPALPGRF
jgi:hypothetical protein